MQVRILDFQGNCHGAPLLLNKVPCTGLSTVIKQASKSSDCACFIFPISWLLYVKTGFRDRSITYKHALLVVKFQPSDD